MTDTLTINNGRHYIIKEGSKTLYLPSVTTIIGFNSDDSWIKDWQDRIGKDKADAISKFSANRGTCMHLFCEYYLDSKEKDKKRKLIETLKRTTSECIRNGFTDKEIEVGRKLFFNMYNSKTFDRVKKVIIQEVRLHSFIGGGYAGRVDLAYRNHEGGIVIEDFKSSKRPKKLDQIDNYKMQISAYFIAYWQMFGEKPSHGEIWISNDQDNEPQIIRIELDEIKKFYKEFVDGVKAYHKHFKLTN
jgi:hypothetical protein